MAKISFQGLGSGIDGAGVAKALYEQATQRNGVYKRQIKQKERENTSLEKLRTLLLDVSNKLDGFRTANNGGSETVTTSSNENVATAASSGGVSAATYSVNVQQVASNAKASFQKSLSSGSDTLLAPGESGAFSFTVGEGTEAKTISVAADETTSAQQFIDAFNSQAGGAASASLVNVGTTTAPSYRVTFSTSSTGTEKGSLSLDSSPVGSTVGFTVSQATNARFTVGGIADTLERATNSVTDVLPGIAIQLKGVGQSEIKVAPNISATADKVERFVAAFNTLQEFVRKEGSITATISDGEPELSFGSLSQTNVDEESVQQIRGALLGAQSQSGASSLSALGITTQRDGSLAFNRQAFEQAAAKDPTGVATTVASVADRVSGVGGIVNQITGYQRSIDQTVQGNKRRIDSLEQNVSRIERSAKSREEATRQQFANLERTIARLQSGSDVLSRIFQR